MAGTWVMRGKVVVMTGATSGIGQVAAERLGEVGEGLVLVAHDRQAGQPALARLREHAPGIAHSIDYADLARLPEMKRVAAEIAAAESRIDVLINNAGALFGSRHVTEDGLELTFATNHMAYFVLTAGLHERLRASVPARVISTASDAHQGTRLDFDDLQSANGYRGFKVYGRSKLCNILFTRELARRWADAGVTANCLHPGFVATRFGDQSGGLLSLGVRIAKTFAISPARGAETIVYLASSPQVADVSGGSLLQCRPPPPPPGAQAQPPPRR